MDKVLDCYITKPPVENAKFTVVLLFNDLTSICILTDAITYDFNSLIGETLISRVFEGDDLRFNFSNGRFFVVPGYRFFDVSGNSLDAIWAKTAHQVLAAKHKG